MTTIPDWMQAWYEDSYQNYKHGPKLQFTDVVPVSDGFVRYDALQESSELPRVAQIKLNGGLGTSMGCEGPKSLIQCDSSGRSFIDVIVDMHERSPISSHLVFLNSFNTSSATSKFLNSTYPDLNWVEVMQYPFKKINLATNEPFEEASPNVLNPPGHGSVYFDLYHSGCLHQLQSDGVDYLFISNADNLAASCDARIAAYLKSSNCPFLMELTPKRETDVKGGTIVKKQGKLTLWEIAQVSSDQMELFQSQPVFNTNNIWVNVSALIQVIESNALALDLILNKKVKDGVSFIQMEYAMGSAIQSFSDAQAMIVPRSRFFPVKKTSDLFLLLSDFTRFDSSGQLQWDDNRVINITCEPPFDTVAGFFDHLTVVPSIHELKQLVLKGEIFFNHQVTLTGDVHISLNDSESLVIDESIVTLENVVYKNGAFSPILSDFN